MIMKFSNSSYEYAGRVNDEIWNSSGLRGIARRRIRPATRATKLEFRALFSLRPALAEWDNLGSSTQTEWNELAVSTFGWPLQGSPRFMDGETYFANYYTVLLTLDPYASVPDAPDAGPTWQTRPKFWEFATWESGVYTLKAETAFDPDTVLLFSGLPPSRTGYKPDFAREVFIGNEQLYSGLYPDEEYTSVDFMMSDAFGYIDSTQKIWGRVWEIQDGYIRTLKDPCTPDPTDEPAESTLGLEIYNDYNSQVYSGTVEVWDEFDEYLGSVDFEAFDAFTTETATIDILEGYTRADIFTVVLTFYWYDGESLYYGTQYDESDPFQYSIEPDF